MASLPPLAYQIRLNGEDAGVTSGTRIVYATKVASGAAVVKRLAVNEVVVVVQDRPIILVFDDPYGVRWEVTTVAYDDPHRSLSTGARLGKWVKMAVGRAMLY